MRIFADNGHRSHHPEREMHRGQFVPCFETPRRAEIVREALEAAKLGPIESGRDYGLEPILRIHDSAYLEFLQTAYQRWLDEGGEGDMVPYTWMHENGSRTRPRTIHGLLGSYASDSGTPIMAGTWNGVLSATQLALTAADTVAQEGSVAFALTRPPGHHASSAVLGGYCFLNHAAIAAQWLRDHGHDRVAILDVDYHHGNGTQAIFEHRADLLFVSIHADPDEAYPYFSGLALYRAWGLGEATTINYPLPLGTDWNAYDATLRQAIDQIDQFQPRSLVVSLGLDTYERDPISRFSLSTDDFLKLGARLVTLDLPTVIILEGGYATNQLGINLVNVLQGWHEAS